MLEYLGDFLRDLPNNILYRCKNNYRSLVIYILAFIEEIFLDLVQLSSTLYKDELPQRNCCLLACQCYPRAPFIQDHPAIGVVFQVSNPFINAIALESRSLVDFDQSWTSNSNHYLSGWQCMWLFVVGVALKLSLLSTPPLLSTYCFAIETISTGA